MKPLILFTGPEGSGKTTLALNLKSMLEQKGYRVKIVRIRGTHTFAFLLAIFLKRALKLYGYNLHYYRVRIPKKLEKFWFFIEFISVIPLLLVFYNLYRIWQIVISERSLLDLIIWIYGGLNEKEYIVRSFTFRLLLAFVMKYKPIYITADINDLIKRKPYEKDLILSLLPYYEAFSKILNLKVVDTSKYDLSYCLISILDHIGIQGIR
ncbi:MAG: adenylyl-sulfate kinase [Desulfurococcaceae archaeon]